jgi:hypothetical protein
MKKLILLVASAVLAFAQNPSPGPVQGFEVVRVVEVRNADPAAIVNTLGAVVPGVSRNERMLVLRGSESVVTMLEDAVKKLDIVPPAPPELRPSPNIELTVHLVYGSSQESQTVAIPQELEATVRQLRALFPYKSYRVLDTLFMRGRNGNRVELNGTLPGDNSSYQFQYSGTLMPGPAPRTVRLDKLDLGFRLKSFTDAAKTQYQFMPSGIQTNLDAREGQKTVVGKANMTGTEDAIILVVTPRVIE